MGQISVEIYEPAGSVLSGNQHKEAMLADPEKARMIAGISIGSEGEDFIAEPFEAEISAATAA